MNPRCLLLELSRKLANERHMIEGAICRVTGLTFRKYREHVILAATLWYLKDKPSLSEKQIAAEPGFSGTPSLSRLVRRLCGCTASAMRKSQYYRVGQDVLPQIPDLLQAPLLMARSGCNIKSNPQPQPHVDKARHVVVERSLLS